MRIAVTGATGFLGRAIVRHLAENGHDCVCWYRMTSDRGGFEGFKQRVSWLPGSLIDPQSSQALVQNCDAVVHAALDRPGRGFRGDEGELSRFAEANILGTLRLIKAARGAGVERFIFISSCAVHEVILDDRPLDETHPLWPKSHYGAHKAAIEGFVHSFGFGENYNICALRPTGIYGLARPVEKSKWFELVNRVARGESVMCGKGGKEVHADDVAHAVSLLLRAPSEQVRGQAFNCYDRYVSELEVALIARELTGSSAVIEGEALQPKHQIETGKLARLGMKYGGRPQLVETIETMLKAARIS